MLGLLGSDRFSTTALVILDGSSTSAALGCMLAFRAIFILVFKLNIAIILISSDSIFADRERVVRAGDLGLRLDWSCNTLALEDGY